MKEMSAEELKNRLQSGDPVAVVDIRELSEFEDWHIHGSTNLPLYDALKQGRESVGEELKRIPNDRPLVAVCNRGNTSKAAAEILESMGYDAFSLAGGIQGWSGVWSEAKVPIRGVKDATCIQIRRNGKGCLSYLFGSAGEAAVVDPCVDTSAYKNIAERERMKITKVIETHVHADHVSRARALSEETGATLHFYQSDRVQFEYTPMGNGDKLRVGNLTAEVIATPGHTADSVCLLIEGEVLISGDTMFIEGVGRPDLEEGDAGSETGATDLYNSLHGKVLNLAGTIQVCPGHYGKPIGFDGIPVAAPLAELRSKLEILNMDEASFVKTVVGGLGAKPPNFTRIIAINEGKAELGPLDPLELEAGPNRCAVK